MNDFWTLALLLGVPMSGLAVLFLLARQGDVLALVVLAVIGAVALIGLGAWITLKVIDRMHEAEQLRLQAMRDMALLEQGKSAHDAELLERILWLQERTRALPAPQEIGADLDEDKHSKGITTWRYVR